jgi:hypothetical protein
MILLANEKKKQKQALLIFLIIFLITLTFLLIVYGLKYLRSPESSQKTTKPNIQGLQLPPNPPKVPPILLEPQTPQEAPKDPQPLTESPKIPSILSEPDPPPELPKDPSIIREQQTPQDLPKIPPIISESELPPESPKMPPILAEPQPTPEPTQVPQIFLDLEKKIFTERGPLDLSEEELEGLNLLSTLKDDDPLFKDILSDLKDDNLIRRCKPSSLKDDPILQSKMRCLTIRKLYKDIKIAIDVYQNIKDNIIMKLTTLSPEAINSFWNLTAEGVSCFKFIRYKLQESPNESQTKTRPILDFRLDDSFESELSSYYPNFQSSYQILSSPSFNLKELFFAFPIATKYSKDNPGKGPAPVAFEISLFEKFFAIASYEFNNDPCELFDIFKTDRDFNMLLLFICIRETLTKYSYLEIENGYFTRSLRNSLTANSERRYWIYSSFSFLKNFMDRYFLPDHFSDMNNSISLKRAKTYKVLFELIEKFYNKFSPEITDYAPVFVRFEFPVFFKYWKFSIFQEIEQGFLLCSSKSNFDNLKTRFFASMKSPNSPRGNINLIPLIYWSTNFRLPQNFDIEFLVTLSDPRDVVLIMICCHVGLVFKEKENLIKILYTEENWFSHDDFYKFIPFILYFLYDTIPLELFRSEEQWNVWNSHFYVVVTRLQKFNKPIFSSLLRQVAHLRKQQVSIHAVRLSFKEQLEDALKNIDLSTQQNIAELSIIGTLNELRLKCDEDGIDYAEAFKFQCNEKIPTWIIDMINNYAGFISTFVAQKYNRPRLPLSENLDLISSQDMQAFQDYISKSSRREGVVDFFNTLDFFIELENSRLPAKEIQPPKSSEIVLDEVTVKKISPLSTYFTNWTLDLECNRFSSTTLESKFGHSRKAFVRNFTSLFIGVQQERTPFQQAALEHAKIEVSCSVKYEFWHDKWDFIKAINQLFQPQNFPSWVNSWKHLVEECLKLIDLHMKKAQLYPDLKLNSFAGLYLKAKLTSGENELSAMKAFNSLFRLLEWLIDSQPIDEKILKEILERVLFRSFLFCKTEFKGMNRAASLFHDRKIYDKVVSHELAFSFKNYFLSKPEKYEFSFTGLFEEIKRTINDKNLPLDPVQLMVVGREIETDCISSFISSYCMGIFDELEPFRNPKEQSKTILLNCKSKVHEELLKVVKRIPSQITGISVSFGARYQYALSGRQNFKSHPIEPSFKDLFDILDVAYKSGLYNLEPLIDNFVNAKLQPLIPKK